MDFLKPIRLGEVIQLEAFVTRTFRTSMEIYVRVDSEQPYTGERRMTVTAFLTGVALGEDGRPSPVPEVYPETEEERRLHESALERHERRLERRRKRKEI